MKLIVLGTGHSMATECFNTCFAIENKNKYFLIDSGGGQAILKQLKNAHISIEKIKAVFISHTHIDHILGLIFIIRSLLPKYFKNKITEELKIYGNDKVICTLKRLTSLLMPSDFEETLNNKIIFEIVKNDETKMIIDHKVNFFDIQASKVKQFGFVMNLLENKKFTFIGDECCSVSSYKYIENSEWLFADAYMAGNEAEKYNPMTHHHHSTVAFTASIAEKFKIKNLILSHTIDTDLDNRKKKFTKDASKYFRGNIYVPNDNEIIKLY